MTDKDLEQQWLKFADIPFNDADEIEEPFMHWSIGTDRFDIWHWFDDNHSQGLVHMMWHLMK